MKLIPLTDALTQMERNGETFSLKFVTADRKRKVGGEIIELSGCKLHGMGGMGVKNSTRNVLLPSGKIRKVHIRLILEYNGSTIVY